MAFLDNLLSRFTSQRDRIEQAVLEPLAFIQRRLPSAVQTRFRTAAEESADRTLQNVLRFQREENKPKASLEFLGRQGAEVASLAGRAAGPTTKQLLEESRFKETRVGLTDIFIPGSSASLRKLGISEVSAPLPIAAGVIAEFAADPFFGGKKKAATSVVQRVGPKGLEFFTVSTKNFGKVQEIIDSGKRAIAGKNIGGFVYHLTAKTPDEMIRKGAKFVGEISPNQLPKPPVGRQLNVGGGKFNLDDLDVTDDVFDFVSGESSKIQPLIQAERRGLVTFEQTRQAANKLGMTVEDLRKKKIGKALNDAEITAGGDLLKTISEKNFSLIELYKSRGNGVIANGATQVERIDLLSRMNEQAIVTAKFLGARGELGRALNASKIFKKAADNPLQSKFDDVFKLFKGEGNVDEIIARYGELLTTDGEQAAYKYLRGLHKRNFSDFIIEVFYNSILSAPSTHIINGLSNTATTLLSPIEKLTSAAFDAPRALLTGTQRQRLFGEAAADIVGGLSGYKEGMRKGLHTLVNGYSLDDAGKLELRGTETFLTGKLGIIKPTRWLVAADQLFKGINYNADLYSKAYRMAVNEGSKGSKMFSRIAELINNPTAEMMEEAGKMAKYRVFQQNPGKTTAAVMKAKTSLGPAGTFIAPFIRTPVNLVKFGAERSPLGFLNIARTTGGARSDAIGKAVIGSGIAAGAAIFAMEGKITASSPKNPAERDAFYRSGKQPFSIKIGDKWISYQRMEPFNQAFIQVATIHNEFKDGKTPELASVGRIGSGIARNLVGQTYLQGINSIFKAIDEPERYGGQFLERLVTSFIPGASFLRTVTRITDPVIRDPEGLGEALRASIPGLSFTIQPRRNVFGEEIKRDSPVGDFAGNVFPIKITRETANQVDEELARLGITIGFPTQTEFKKAGGEKGREAGDLFLSSSGGYMRSWMSGYIQSDEYANANDEERRFAFDKIKDLSRDEFRNTIIASAYLFNEGQKDRLEDKKDLFNELVKAGVINNAVGDEIVRLREGDEEDGLRFLRGGR